MPDLTKRQEELIRPVAETFASICGPVRIERLPYIGGFHVYFPANAERPMERCDSLEQVEGFLWGCVTGVCAEEFRSARQTFSPEEVENAEKV